MRHKPAIKEAKNRTSTEFRFFIAVVKLRDSISIWIFIIWIARKKDSNFMGIFTMETTQTADVTVNESLLMRLCRFFPNYSSLTICKGSRTGNSGNNLEFSVLTLRTYVPWFPPPSHKLDFKQPLAEQPLFLSFFGHKQASKQHRKWCRQRNQFTPTTTSAQRTRPATTRSHSLTSRDRTRRQWQKPWRRKPIRGARPSSLSSTSRVSTSVEPKLKEIFTLQLAVHLLTKSAQC